MIASLLTDFEVRDRRLARARTRRENLRMLAVAALAIAIMVIVFKSGDCARHPLYEDMKAIYSRSVNP